MTCGGRSSTHHGDGVQACATHGGPLMAVDLGGEFIKVAMVKAGRTPISIVPNEMSKRRTSAQVAFVGGDRLLGEEAAALGVRFPDRVYARWPAGARTAGRLHATMLPRMHPHPCAAVSSRLLCAARRSRDLLGKPAAHASVEVLLRSSYLPYTLVGAPPRGPAARRAAPGEVYSAEVLTVRPPAASSCRWGAHCGAARFPWGSGMMDSSTCPCAGQHPALRAAHHRCRGGGRACGGLRDCGAALLRACAAPGHPGRRPAGRRATHVPLLNAGARVHDEHGAGRRARDAWQAGDMQLPN